MIPSSLPIKHILFFIPFSFFTLILFLHLFYPFNHPLAMPGKRNPSSPSPAGAMLPVNKKLRRLPHVFSKVLELPFHSDADVSVEDGPDCIRFIADGVSFSGGVRTRVIELHPGVTKVIIRRRESQALPAIDDDFELNLWRFRLPETSRPEMVTAGFSGGRLVVTVPKSGWRLEKNISCAEDYKGGGEFRGNMGISILVE